jgi:aminoglycoside phosphotransferase (APT) family kinase protein
MTANFLRASIIALREQVVPAVSTDQARINLDQVSRVLYMLYNRFTRRAGDLKELQAKNEMLQQDLNAILANPESAPPVTSRHNPEFSAIEVLENEVYAQEMRIVATMPQLLALAKDGGAKGRVAAQLLRRVVDVQKDFLAAQDPDILKGSEVCYQGGRISEERAPFDQYADMVADINRESLEKHLQESFPGCKVSEFSAMAGGFSKSTFFFTLNQPDGKREKLVMRKDVPAEYVSSVAYEFSLLRHLHDIKFPVAEPVWLETDPSHFGGRFMLSRRVGGSTDITRWAANQDQVENFARRLAKLMADLHSIPLHNFSHWSGAFEQSAGELMATEIQRWHDLFRENTREARPILEMVIAWIKANLPQSAFNRPGCLVHGDIGFHNIMIDGGNVTALLDWEFSHPGDPIEDLMYAKSFIEQVMDWDDFKSYYQEYGGQPSTAEEEFFYEVWAKTRNPLSSVRGATIFADAMPDNIAYATAGYILARYLEPEAAYFVLDHIDKPAG